MPLRGGGAGVGRLMAKTILNFHFDYWNPSLILNTPIYDGQREVNERGGCKKTVHEVVHVSKSWLLCSVMQAKICKQDVDEVIKPWDKVFLGHQLQERQFAANASEAITKRALKCAEKPYIVFDYDHR